MSGRTLARTRNDLSDFLIWHRAKLTPADVGLPITGGRRTPGLRREEVAQLAGVGLTWYTWFEQGRGIQVSESFLLKVAKALRLDDAECSRLFLLAHRRPPPPEAYQWPSVSPLIQQLLDDLTVRPAYVLNCAGTLSRGTRRPTACLASPAGSRRIATSCGWFSPIPQCAAVCRHGRTMHRDCLRSFAGTCDRPRRSRNACLD